MNATNTNTHMHAHTNQMKCMKRWNIRWNEGPMRWDDRWNKIADWCADCCDKLLIKCPMAWNAQWNVMIVATHMHTHTNERKCLRRWNIRWKCNGQWNDLSVVWIGVVMTDRTRRPMGWLWNEVKDTMCDDYSRLVTRASNQLTISDTLGM